MELVQLLNCFSLSIFPNAVIRLHPTVSVVSTEKTKISNTVRNDPEKIDYF